jgi:hypothetical protein
MVGADRAEVARVGPRLAQSRRGVNAYSASCTPQAAAYGGLGRKEMTMAARRFSQRQKCMLAWLAADARRTGGGISSSHRDLVVALQRDKGHIRHRLRTLEARGVLVIGRSRGGQAESLYMTAEGKKWAVQLEGSGD